MSSWQGLLSTIIGLAVMTLLGVGVRLLFMVTIQQRRERLNRQINERLRILIAAYKVLGGSFTGDLTVDPTHLRELRRRSLPPRTEVALTTLGDIGTDGGDGVPESDGSDRSRRIRDAVEAALADVILLGTEPQVRLAAAAAQELAAGRPVHIGALVVELRAFIRAALDLEPIPAEVLVPVQGPTRPAAQGNGRSKGDGAAARDSKRGGGGMGEGTGGGVGAGGSVVVDDGSGDEPRR